MLFFYCTCRIKISLKAKPYLFAAVVLWYSNLNTASFILLIIHCSAIYGWYKKKSEIIAQWQFRNLKFNNYLFAVHWVYWKSSTLDWLFSINLCRRKGLGKYNWALLWLLKSCPKLAILCDAADVYVLFLLTHFYSSAFIFLLTFIITEQLAGNWENNSTERLFNMGYIFIRMSWSKALEIKPHNEEHNSNQEGTEKALLSRGRIVKKKERQEMPCNFVIYGML